ncbi:hypothetical protein FRC11_001661, partial [Ceratobasidium sp. 423]
LNTSMGYTMLRKSASFFLRLVAAGGLPELWTQDVPQRKFIVLDTISALALGTAPLLGYDTTIDEQFPEPSQRNYLEAVDSLSAVIVLSLVEVNLLRVSRLLKPVDTTDPEAVQEIEGPIRDWYPTIAFAVEPSQSY